MYKKKIKFLTTLMLISAIVLTSAIITLGVRAIDAVPTDAYTSTATLGSLTNDSHGNSFLFDGEVLGKLYDKITGKTNSTYQMAHDAIKNAPNTTLTSNGSITQTHSKNYSQIGGIKLDFAGYTWDVVYLTTNTDTTGNGDLIATLWMSQERGASVWSSSGVGKNYSNSTIRSYIQSEYSSLISKYSTYLQSPNQVYYQKGEDLTWSWEKGDAYLGPNEAWGAWKSTGGPQSSLGWHSNLGGTSGVEQQANYFDWANDKVWLPSLTEIGGKWNGATEAKQHCVSLWGIPNSDKILQGTNLSSNTITTWLRSGADNDASYAYSLTASGGWHYTSTTSSYAVRPALHLNLKSVALSATQATSKVWHNPVPQPGTVAFDYDPDVTYNLATTAEWRKILQMASSTPNVSGSVPDWYDETLHGNTNVVTIGESLQYREPSYAGSDTGWKTNPEGDKKIKRAGEYRLAMTLTNYSKNYARWRKSSDETDEATKYFVITVNQVEIQAPTIEVAEKQYAGDGGTSFSVVDWDNAVELQKPTESDLKDKVTIGANNVIAKDVGDFYITASLIDSINYKLTGETKLYFSVIPAEVGVYLTDDQSNTAITCGTNSQLKLRLYLEDFNQMHQGKKIGVKVVASADRKRDVDIATAVVEYPTGMVLCTVVPNLKDLLDVNTDYKLTVKLDNTATGCNNKYYSPVMALGYSTTLRLFDNSDSVLKWQLYKDDTPISAQYMFANDTDTDVKFSGADILLNIASASPFALSKYRFEIEASKNRYEIVTSMHYKGYYTTKKGDSDELEYATDVGTYVTHVLVYNKGTMSNEEFEIEWEIVPLKFDLSNIKWQNNGKMPFNPNGVMPAIDEKSLPVGLTVEYIDAAKGYVAGPQGDATVHFTCIPELVDNCILPDMDDKTTYTFTSQTATDFAWTIQWSIEKAVIQAKWEKHTFTNSNGVTFDAYYIAGYDSILKYVFYQTNESGTPLNPNVIVELDDMEIVENVRKFFKVKAEFIAPDNADNYVLPTGFSPRFELGKYSVEVNLGIKNDKLPYNAKNQDISLDILKGTISLDNLQITYYRRSDVTPMSEKPKNVGQYTAEVSIKSSVEGFHLAGDNVQGGKAVFDFEIVQREIDNSQGKWIVSHNPPSLDISFADVQGIVYEFANEDGSPLEYNQLERGVTYKIRAVVRDQVNYIFKVADSSGDPYSTDWVTFTISETEEIFNPNDPQNPFYPQDPDNPGTGDNPGPTNPTNPSDGSSILDKIKQFFEKLIEDKFPLWQVCTIAVGGLLSLIFLIKCIQYGNRKKKAKGEAKKIRSRAYAAIAPIFATDVVYAGLTNKIWSIIAFSVAALALVMFVAALIARSAWKKAELAKETAKEESDKALQERMLSVGAQGGAVQAVGAATGAGVVVSDNSAILEAMRLDMEERRRADEERRREEEARRREEEARHREEMDAMKMMFANMMGRSQDIGSEPIYGSVNDADLLAEKVFARLLPAVQQMLPDATAYLNAPSQETEELKALVEEQNEQMRAMSEAHSEEMRAMTEQMAAMQEQLSSINGNMVEGVLLPDQSEEINSLNERIADLQYQLAAINDNIVEGELLPDQSEEIKSLSDKIAQMQEQLANNLQDDSEAHTNEIEALTAEITALKEQILNADNGDKNDLDVDDLAQKVSEKIGNVDTAVNVDEIVKKVTEQITPTTTNNTTIVQGASEEEMLALNAQIAQMKLQMDNMAFLSVDELDDTDFDDEEEWDSILDEEDDDFVEAVIIEEDGTVKKTSPNFRMRLKQSSDKNREWYTVIKNMFCSQKGVTYRVCKRVEKIRYQGQVVGVIGIAKRSIKLWLALKPYEYDARRYHHKDVSDKPRFVDVPMYVRVGSDRALTRAQELILALFQELNMEARKRYNGRSIQELIFTLKHNRLLTNKQNKQLLCEVMHVHDCDILDDETAEKCIEAKNVEFIDDSLIETVKLDDIDAKFQDGNRVTLDKLKKVGLVSEDCTGYNVVADKRLTKPLIIVANDFNLAAVKLITLTGGRAIKLQQI